MSVVMLLLSTLVGSAAAFHAVYGIPDLHDPISATIASAIPTLPALAKMLPLVEAAHDTHLLGGLYLLLFLPILLICRTRAPSAKPAKCGAPSSPPPSSPALGAPALAPASDGDADSDLPPASSAAFAKALDDAADDQALPEKRSRRVTAKAAEAAADKTVPKAKKAPVPESILDQAAMNGDELYLVKWRGFSETQASWEAAASVPKFESLYAAFDAKRHQENAVPVQEEEPPTKRSTRRSVAPAKVEAEVPGGLVTRTPPKRRPTRGASRTRSASRSRGASDGLSKPKSVSPAAVRTRTRRVTSKA